MNITIHMVGGGRLGLHLDAEGLEDVAALLRHERGLLGEVLPDDTGDRWGASSSPRTASSSWRKPRMRATAVPPLWRAASYVSAATGRGNELGLEA